MNGENLLKKVQSYRFAMHDMLLYLDTHPEDKRAFAMYQELAKKAKQAMAEYNEACMSLTPMAAAKKDTFTWTQSPWPWEKEANY